MRIRLLPLLVALLLLSSAGPEPRARLGRTPRMTAAPIALDSADPARRKVGALAFLGGIWLTSPDSAFGGFSAMQVDRDWVLLLSDGGAIVRFRIGADWKPRDVTFRDLAQGPGSGWLKRERDSEALAADPATGRTWVGFENANAIWRYDSASGTAERHARPPAMARWSANGGIESLTRLAKGGFVAIAEASRGAKRRGRAGVRFLGDPVEAPGRAFVFTYMPPEGYDPSDLAELPDGRLLVLNRRVTLMEMFTTKLVVLDSAAIRPGAEVRGREIATIGPPLTRDNFEALAVAQEGGATIVWLASDDNQQWFERSLLMKFRLDLPR